MKRILFLLPILACASPAIADPVNPGAECVETAANAEGFAAARQIVSAILPEEKSEEIMHQLMAALVNQMKNGKREEMEDKGLQAILDRYMQRIPDRLGPVVKRHLPEQRKAFACAYTHEFSIDELRSIENFAATPTGKHYLSRSATLINDPAVAAANQAYFRDAQDTFKATRSELEAEIADYKAKKSDAKR